MGPRKSRQEPQQTRRQLAVAYTLRGDSVRLISARKAEKHEREDYWNREI